jgi:hypothetical protein
MREYNNITLIFFLGSSMKRGHRPRRPKLASGEGLRFTRISFAPQAYGIKITFRSADSQLVNSFPFRVLRRLSLKLNDENNNDCDLF